MLVELDVLDALILTSLWSVPKPPTDDHELSTCTNLYMLLALVALVALLELDTLVSRHGGLHGSQLQLKSKIPLLPNSH